MSTTETTTTASDQTQPIPVAKLPNARRKARAEGRKKRVLKLKTDKEFAKQFFADKSKRAGDKKTAFRKKKNKKK